MQIKAKFIGRSFTGISFGLMLLSSPQSGRAAFLEDGSLDGGQGYQLVSTQLHVTDSTASYGGGAGGSDHLVTASNTDPLIQLSNAYAVITPDDTLHLFIGGSIRNDVKYAIALQTNSNGVSNLNGQNIQGLPNPYNGPGINDVQFDPGFKPNALILVDGSSVDAVTGTFYPTVNVQDLTTKTAVVTGATAAVNNALVYTAVGTKQTARTINSYSAPADPGFANASTGLELTISLTSLGYDGQAVRAIAFPDVGSGTRTDDQVLAPFTNFQPADPNNHDYDYTYYNSDRQFTNETAYPGDQFFDIPGPNATPEPGVAALCGLGFLPLLQRRGRRGLSRGPLGVVRGVLSSVR